MKFFETVLEEQETTISILYKEQLIRVYSSEYSTIQRLTKVLGKPSIKYKKSKTYWSGASWDISFFDLDKIKDILYRDTFIDEKLKPILKADNKNQVNKAQNAYEKNNKEKVKKAKITGDKTSKEKVKKAKTTDDKTSKEKVKKTRAADDKNSKEKIKKIVAKEAIKQTKSKESKIKEQENEKNVKSNVQKTKEPKKNKKINTNFEQIQFLF